MEFIDPLTIKQEQMPVVVFVKNSRSIVSLFIRWRTSGIYNHAMIMVRPGFVVSQGFTGLKELPIQDFMKSEAEDLKFVSIAGVCDEADKFMITSKVASELNECWYKKTYDSLGIIGQLTGLRFIQNPWKEFCSERVAADLRLVKKLRPFISTQPSPEELNSQMKKANESLGGAIKVLGHYSKDTGV